MLFRGWAFAGNSCKMEGKKSSRKKKTFPKKRRAVHRLALVGIHRPSGSQKAVAKTLYSSCSGVNHGVDLAGLV